MKFHRLTPTAIVVSIGFLTYIAGISTSTDNPSAVAAEQANDSFSPYVDSKGNISLPQGYKQTWAHLGSWAVAKKQGTDIHEMHDVYTPRETITAYNKTGKFPDGAVLVKEVRNSKSDRMTTGHSAWSTDIKIWFVMIKDQQERFENNDHWGDGWGWALFEAKDPKKNVSVSYDSTCLSCHVPAEDTDWIYVNGYPDLKKPN
jgi:hypothetical protein